MTQISSHTPAFLSRFPRSLSSLSLGTKKNKPPEKILPVSPPHAPHAAAYGPVDGSAATNVVLSPPSLHGRTHSVSVKHNVTSPTKNQQKSSKRPSMEKTKSEDIPPPLPQRNNVGRKSMPTSPDSSVVDGSNKLSQQISDLDKSSMQQLNVPLPSLPEPCMGASRKRSKGKKAHSDPKMSTQMFIQMEARQCMSDGAEPPPLPPRQPSLAEPIHNLACGNNNGNASTSSNNSSTTDINGRYLPNSVSTLLNYPLVTTCTAVKDNFSAFPLSHRPNIKQQLQQTQQQQQQQQHKSGVSRNKNRQNEREIFLSLKIINTQTICTTHPCQHTFSTKKNPFL